jgi:hypothetical protein
MGLPSLVTGISPGTGLDRLAAGRDSPGQSDFFESPRNSFESYRGLVWILSFHDIMNTGSESKVSPSRMHHYKSTTRSPSYRSILHASTVPWIRLSSES